MSVKVTNPSRVPKNAVLLSEVSSLTFYHGKPTKSRRVDAVPQLECIGPEDVCKLYSVDIIRCVNEGADYDAENIQWSCKASLPEEFKLGSTDVVCEGYESSNDPYVLKGSCGVEYRLLLTDKGEEKYGAYINRQHRTSTDESSSSSWASILFFAVFMSVLFIIGRGIWSSWHRTHPQAGRPPHRYRPLGSNNGDNDNNGDDDDDPPPPYDGPPLYYSQPRPKTTAKQTSSTRTAVRNSNSSQPSSSRSDPQRDFLQGWRPGFWTGTAAGAAAGYFAGTRDRRQEAVPRREAAQSHPPQQSEMQQRPQAPPAPAAPRVQSSFSSSAPAHSSTRHDSTGFGGTRRR